MIDQNDTYSLDYSFSQEDVVAFSKISGDINPVHLDEAYAAGTVFKKPILHGFLSASIFSNVLGTKFPGEGTIYMSQNMEFKRPMFAGRTYKASFRAVEVNKEKHRATIETIVTDAETGDVTIAGEARVMNTGKI